MRAEPIPVSFRRLAEGTPYVVVVEQPGAANGWAMTSEYAHEVAGALERAAVVIDALNAWEEGE